MDGSTYLNITAICISIAALAAAVWFARQQVRIAREANHLPVLVELLGQFRNVELNEHFIYVCTKLHEEHPPELGQGISGLPRPAKEAVYDVAYYLQTFAGMSTWGITSEQQVAGMLNSRILQTWNAIAPYVEKEREVGPAGIHMLALLEAFASRAEEQSERAVQDLLNRARTGRRPRRL
ncbi:hypothetical protein AB0M19_25195 [Streptomyces sp. NPDC051920]|uniref:hypothetical protein n=1 Tax=Streptomyces sp. NPDC051920 TaxID=3155523 RepID=UPI00342C25C8